MTHIPVISEDKEHNRKAISTKSNLKKKSEKTVQTVAGGTIEKDEFYELFDKGLNGEQVREQVTDYIHSLFQNK